MSTITTSPHPSDAENSTLHRLEATVAWATGQDVMAIRSQTLTQMRCRTEAKINRPLKFVSRFPLIGRGNVMRKHLISHEEVEAELTKFLR